MADDSESDGKRGRRERLLGEAHVAASVLRAHMSWASERWPDVGTALRAHLGPAALSLALAPPAELAATIRFSDLVEIDRGIAAAAGGDPDAVYEALGTRSARVHLANLHQGYDPEQPHRLFQSMDVLHRSFQDFGRSHYEVTGRRSGWIRVEHYDEYSPVFCASGRGYYAEALRMMQVPGPVIVNEVACQCSGAPACAWELRW